MAVELRITGADDFARLSRRLREAGDKGLRKELLKGLQTAAKPAKDDVKRSFATRLPRRGGLAGVMARSRVSLRTRTGANPSIRIVATSPHNVRAMEAGTIRHPVYGNRGKWASQSIQPGVFTDPIEARAPEVRREMVKVMKTVAKVERG